MSESKAFVLLSGGIDSTTCLHVAFDELDEVVGVSIFYDQRHKKEIQYAREACERLDIDHHVIDLSTLIPRTMLTDRQQQIPSVSYDEIVGVSPTYVPFRNGLMLSAITAFASGHRGADVEDEWYIYFGAHAEDARGWAYPDCTPEFTGAMANAIRVGTYDQIRLVVPFQYLQKWEILQKGENLGVDYAQTWSCYAGGEWHCGVCPTCRARQRAFMQAGIGDPTIYAEEGET